MSVSISVVYPDEQEQSVLGFTFGESGLLVEDAERMRPQIEFAISRLFMARDRCIALIEIANRRRRES